MALTLSTSIKKQKTTGRKYQEAVLCRLLYVVSRVKSPTEAGHVIALNQRIRYSKYKRVQVDFVTA